MSHVPLPSDKSKDTNQGPTGLSSLIIGIEEPELYQHSDRQRHLSTVLFRLSAGSIPGVTERVQVIYSTHSPLLVDLERFEHLRMFQKVSPEDDKPKHARISFATLEDIARSLEQMRGEPRFTYSGDSIKPHLQVLMTPWFNEGFFARLVAVVEGTTDRGTILGIALSMGHDLESQGVSVIPCESKFSMIYAALIFWSLGIPVYAIWDSHHNDNRKQNIRCNHELLKPFARPEEDFPEGATDDFAAFKEDLFETLRNDLGSTLYDQLLSDYRTRLDISDEKKILANVRIMKELPNKQGSKESEATRWKPSFPR